MEKPTSCVVDDLLEQSGFGWFQIRLCILCGMGYFAVGSEILAMVMTQSEVMTTFNLTNSSQYSFLPFFANLASFTSAILVGKWSDMQGRKWPFVFSVWMSAIFGICCGACSFSFWSLILFRSLVGFGLGGITVIDYIVMVESCPRKWRNTACQIVFVSGCLGVVYIALLGMAPLGSILPGVASWRVMMVLGALPLVLTAILRMAISTDTPKYLVTIGKETEAIELVEKMRSVNLEYRKICWDIDNNASGLSNENYTVDQKSSLGNLKQVLADPVTIPLSIVWIVQSLVYWGLTIFLPIFLIRAGITPNTGLLCMAIAELPAVAGALWLSIRFSRVVAIIVCMACSCFGALMTGLTSLVLADSPTANLACITIFYMSLIPIWGVLFVLTPELYSVANRGTGTGFQHMCKSIPSLFAPFLTAAILDNCEEYVCMLIWAGVLAVGVSSCWWLRTRLARKVVE